MSDRECVDLLQWALPRLGLRWEGFRRLRGQVCKRIARRVKELGLEGVGAYRRLVESDPAEWARLDSFCRVTISRFYRDRAVFDALRDRVLPALCEAARARGAAELRAWSAGCASGEEPYTVVLVFEYALRPRFPDLALALRASDSDEGLLVRARAGVYEPSSLRELPPDWVARAFAREGSYEGEHLRLASELRARVTFVREDLRAGMPAGPFDLVLCRNLAFTYFEPEVQRRVLRGLAERLVPGGALVIGGHESLPPDEGVLVQEGALPLFRKP